MPIYQVPILPKSKDYSPDGRYVCESCFNNKPDIDHEEQMIHGFTRTMCVFKSQKNLDKHKETKKHKKNVENGIVCPHCNNLFSKEGYKEHKLQNEALYQIHKIRTKNSKPFICNNFVFNGCRFHSYDAMNEYKNDYQKYLYRKKIYQNDLRLIRERQLHPSRKAIRRLSDGVESIILTNAEKNNKKTNQ